MSVEFIYPEFEVIRNENRCIACRVCERQCANEVHSYDEEHKIMKCENRNVSTASDVFLFVRPEH
mgnify:CR=1 FL=1